MSKINYFEKDIKTMKNLNQLDPLRGYLQSFNVRLKEWVSFISDQIGFFTNIIQPHVQGNEMQSLVSKLFISSSRTIIFFSLENGPI